MKIQFGDGDVCEARITTEHAASSYGIPVLVVEDSGEALGVADAALNGCRIVEATDDERARLQRAGYLLEG